MTLHVVKKLLAMVPILFVVSVMLFVLVNVLPGDAAMGAATENTSQAYIERLRDEMGLNKPIAARYLDWVSGLLRGDMGKSLLTGRPVAQILVQRLPATVELTILAMTIAILVGMPAGVVSAVKRNSPLDVLTSIGAMVGAATPSFLLGIILILVFSLELGLLPASGYASLSKGLWPNLRTMILPALSVGVAFSATIMRQTRSALLEVLNQDYVMTARAKGLSESKTIVKHALRNSLIPVITVLAMQIGRLIGGAVVTESVFVLPGVGREIVDAILSRDFPVVMGLIMFVTAGVILINTLVDIVYIVLDPRISHK